MRKKKLRKLKNENAELKRQLDVRHIISSDYGDKNWSRYLNDNFVKNVYGEQGLSTLRKTVSDLNGMSITNAVAILRAAEILVRNYCIVKTQ